MQFISYMLMCYGDLFFSICFFYYKFLDYKLYECVKKIICIAVNINLMNYFKRIKSNNSLFCKPLDFLRANAVFVIIKYWIIFTAGKNRGEVYEVDTCLYC